MTNEWSRSYHPTDESIGTGFSQVGIWRKMDGPKGIVDQCDDQPGEDPPQVLGYPWLILRSIAMAYLRLPCSSSLLSTQDDLLSKSRPNENSNFCPRHPRYEYREVLASLLGPSEKCRPPAFLGSYPDFADSVPQSPNMAIQIARNFRTLSRDGRHGGICLQSTINQN
jgi:hypothetical protein